MPDTIRSARRMSDLAGPEARLLCMLRLWHLGPGMQTKVWSDLSDALGSPRATACLSAFENFFGLLTRSAWIPPAIAAPGDEALTADEDSVCRIVMHATEGAREEALLHAAFLVRPQSLLPLIHAAERTGLPLLCADCRARLAMCRRVTH